MSDATAWGWSREQKTGDIVIHGPPYPGKDDTCDIVLADGVYLSEEDADTIVRDHNAHDALVEALEEIQVQTHDPVIERLCAAVLPEAQR